MRGYTFAQMGVRDHKVLFEAASVAATDSLVGTWRLQVIDTSDHPTDLARVSFERMPDGRLAARCEAAVADDALLIPPFVLDHFTRPDAAAFESELRKVDAELVLGTWTTTLTGAYAQLLLTGARGLFHVAREKGRGRRFTMHYLLSRS
jgi:hypothetical protein